MDSAKAWRRLASLAGLLAPVNAAQQSVSTQTDVNWYYDHWCGGDLVYLDDANCQKVFPSQLDREWTCPILTDNLPTGFKQDAKLYDVSLDATTLKKYLSVDVNMCLVVTKRKIVEGEVTLFNKYFCADDDSVSVPYQPWSSSKIFAMSNAASHLRTNETSCAQLEFGIDGSVQGSHGKTPMGDLATVVVTYDHTAGYTSNSLSSYFHDFGWRSSLHDLVANGDWLGNGIDSGDTLGGNYGEKSPADLGYKVTSASTTDVCTADRDPWPVIYDNALSALTEVEMTRRVAMYHDIEPSLRFPGVQWEDAKNILYGAEESLLFPGLEWGGMTADIAVFLQSTLDMDKVENDAKGQWRIFSKLGAGWSDTRSAGEIVSNSYACLPVLDDNLSPVVGEGLEFTVTVRGSVPGDSSLTKVETIVSTAFEEAVSALLSGKLF